ncbi:hypothetical protein MMC13_003864 [Lambiella insularis]|nr:hypothetical protein [Lambiella insularis]
MAHSPLPTPTSSRRTSTDTVPRSHDTSPARLPHRRGNRAALRDYYGLRNAASAEETSGVQHEDAEVKESELDQEGFDAEGYVRKVLRKENLEGVLKIEGGLVNEIRGLDGERKALVYDNYSKLITATDTIRKMRTNMDPLTPTTSNLAPAIAHIATTAASLAHALRDRVKVPSIVENVEVMGLDDEGRERQRQTVRWVLDAPRRLQQSVESGERERARRDWEEVRDLLNQWNGTKGVEETRQACEQALTHEPSS